MKITYLYCTICLKKFAVPSSVVSTLETPLCRECELVFRTKNKETDFPTA